MNTVKTIAIVSGKGGTGKTTVISSFASMAKSVIMADCDVDAPDLHLIVQPEITRKNIFRGGKIADVDPDICIKCDICSELCEFNAITASSEGITIDHIACEGCSVCQWFCPVNAINMVEQDTGEWYVSNSKYGKMIHARLGIGAENSGRLVTVVRNMAMGIAEANGDEFLLIDGSPGIGCPVIASITGVDYALIITEPTLSGEHDMKRIADLTRHFNIKTGICVNKCDLNEEITARMIDYGNKTGNMIVGQIPFHKSATEAMINEIPVVECSDSPLVEHLVNLWDKVRSEVEHLNSGG